MIPLHLAKALHNNTTPVVKHCGGSVRYLLAMTDRRIGLMENVCLARQLSKAQEEVHLCMAQNK